MECTRSLGIQKKNGTVWDFNSLLFCVNRVGSARWVRNFIHNDKSWQ